MHHTRFHYSLLVLGYILKYVSFMLAYDLVCLHHGLNMGRNMTLLGTLGGQK